MRTFTWPLLRSLLIAAVLLVHGCMGAPIPHIVHPRELKDPVAAEEVRSWAARLTALGLEISPEQLGAQVVSWTKEIGGAHRSLLAPLRPVFRWTGTGQSWALFANPDTHPIRLEVWGTRERSARLLYRRGDPEHSLLAEVLDYRRVRGLHDSQGARRQPVPSFKRFATWFTGRLGQEDPALTKVSFRINRTHTTLPPRPPDRHVRPVFRHDVEVP